MAGGPKPIYRPNALRSALEITTDPLTAPMWTVCKRLSEDDVNAILRMACQLANDIPQLGHVLAFQVVYACARKKAQARG